ncbi:hypothetical protein J41TS12_42660 [Paenibacillus antibioticophila]|uniref:Uncharacterized protein n=1 Tax=Paenibacillus antibioticophila TaxID=1274374 RepID=A0A919XYV9_9BACL|nr:hypothetical protein [Paenibacillus antibioticophila]GIO39405.1 hypothetical protein J41TS12_42660 [Paenibacillus antibioticophila]
MRRSRSVRIQRKRKLKRQKTMSAILQSSLLISSLLACSARQIGATYGEFNSTQDTEGYFQTCRVFPGKIEELLSSVNGHLELAAAHKARIAPVTVTWQVYENSSAAYEPQPMPEAVAVPPSVTNSVYGEGPGYSSPSVTDDVYAGGGEDYTDSRELQLSELTSRLQALQLQFDANQSAMSLITSEATEGARQLQELLLILGELHSNCAEITNIGLLDELSRLSRQELLSLSMQQQIDAAVFYLRRVSQSGLPEDADPSSQLSPIAFMKPEAPGEPEPLDQTAIQQYIELQASIEEAISGLKHSISYLGSDSGDIEVKNDEA